MSVDIRILPFPLAPTEPRHDTKDPAWLGACRWLSSHPECAGISAAVQAAYLAGARDERERRGAP